VVAGNDSMSSVIDEKAKPVAGMTSSVPVVGSDSQNPSHDGI